jgi:tetratricopeptide (TPR) repeat protein
MSSNPLDDPDERERLLLARKYHDAIALDDEIGERGDPWDNRALAHFCLGEFEEGLRILEAGANAIGQRIEGAGNFYCNLMAVGYWCLGDRETAIETLEASVSGLLDRSVYYADGSGGASYGLLLWWMHKQSGNEAGVRTAVKFMKNRAKRKAIANWPGPIARYLLDQISEREMLGAEYGPERNADIEFLNRRYMTTALFYMAAKQGEAGDPIASRDLLMRCACLENPLIEPEWYLARRELGMDFWWKPPDQQN